MPSQIPPIIAFDYLFAPNAQKARSYLYLTHTPFAICEQPFALPRPALTDLGITYRRVPVLSIGKDVFPDNASLLAAMQDLLRAEGKGRELRESGLEGVFEAWGYRSFWLTLPCLPAEFVSPELAKDRADLFPVFARGDFGTLQNSARSELRAFLESAEDGFLKTRAGQGTGAFIGGEAEAGLADVLAVWMVKWWVETVGLAEGVGHGREEFPRVWRWLESFPNHAEAETDMVRVTPEGAAKQLLSSDYALPDIGVDTNDALGLKTGEWVAIEASDAKPGTYPQHGKLVGLNKMKTVIELKNGLRLHFPKVGYFVSKIGESDGAL
ncbi:hypothetical protein Q7P37_002175 [Cladosporium fusiforme]